MTDEADDSQIARCPDGLVSSKHSVVSRSAILLPIGAAT
jgi:hypothetical protein